MVQRLNQDVTDSGGSFREDATSDLIVRSSSRPGILPPKSFRVEKAQNGLRFYAADRGKQATEDGRLSSSVRYRVRWAELVDTSDSDKIDAGFARSIIIGTIEGTGKEGIEASCFVIDPKYGSGYYYCTGVDSAGNEGTEYSTPQNATNQILDGAIPDDVTHPQISESGAVHDDVVFSELSISCVAPFSASFAGVQLFFVHYPTLSAIQEGYFHPYTSSPGGPIRFKVDYPVARRAGEGTLTITNGSAAVTGSGFLTQARAGDLVEAFGVRGTIQSVNSDTSITLTANWSGKSLVASTEYAFIGLVDIYLVAVSKAGTHRFDWTNSPMKSVLMDGDLSAPNSPSIAATSQGNDVRIDLTPVIGTKIDHYVIYRGTGAGLAFSACSPLKTIAADTNNTTGLLQWIDSDFTLYEREQGQVFTYYATAVNTGNQESAPSAEVEAACRLDAPGDNGPLVPARELPKNLLWNGMLSGTGSVSTADATQDNGMGATVTGAAFPPPVGFYRWNGSTTGVGSAPGFQNTTEVVLAMTGAGAGVSNLEQQIDAWGHATASHRRVPRGKMVCFQCKVRTSGGPPNGILYMDILEMNGGALVANSLLRQRLSDDTIDFSATQLSVNGSEIVTDPQIVFGIFQLGSDASVTNLLCRIHYDVTNWNGVNVFITEVMLALADTLTPYTPEHVDANVIYNPPTGGAPDPPGRFDDSEGRFRPRFDLP